MDRYIYAFAAALAASLLLTPMARRLAARFGVVDRPDGKRKLQAKAVPLLGGVAVYLSLLVGLALAVWTAPADADELLPMALMLSGTAGFVCIVGCIDDRYELKPRTKLFMQVIATLPMVLGGYNIERTALFGFPIEFGWLGIPLTVLWLVACINALNLLDGMDGLASVVGLSTAAMIALIAIDSSHAHVSLLAVVLVGSLAGFLVYNLPPASIYLGDSGSMVIGLVVGILAIQGAMKSSATLSLMVPVAVMTIPFLDTALAVIRRRLSGSRFDVADRGHIHHCLLRRGLSVWQALCIIGSLCVATGAAAAAASIWHLEALAWVVAISVATLLVRTRAFGHYELSLVKLATANVLTNFARRLATSAGLHYSNVPNAGYTPPFEQAWQALVDEAAHLDVASLELRRVEQPVDQVLCRWQASNRLAASASSWQYAMRTEAVPGAWIELEAAGDAYGDSQVWNNLQLHSLVARFHRDWSACAVVLSEELRFGQAPVEHPAPTPATIPLARAA